MGGIRGGRHTSAAALESARAARTASLFLRMPSENKRLLRKGGAWIRKQIGSLQMQTTPTIQMCCDETMVGQFRPPGMKNGRNVRHRRD